MHERLVYGLFTPFSAVLIPASCVSVKAFLFPWYSQIRQAAGARRAVRSRPGSAQSPRPPQSTALTVSIKAQQPVAKLARPAECTVRSQGPGRLSLCCVWAPRGENRASGGRGRSRLGGVVRNLHSPPLAWEKDSTLYLSHSFSLEPHPGHRGEPFTTWKMSKAAIPIFVCFFIKSCTKPRPLSFLPTLVPFLVTSSPGLFVKT